MKRINIIFTKEYAVERSQAFKLMSKVLLIAPMSFPASFARSLVAVANHVREENVKEDAFKKVVV